MYKVFVNQVKVYLGNARKVTDFPQSRKKVRLDYDSIDELSDILSYIESDRELKKVHILGNKSKEVWKDFQSLYKIVPAAGGLVHNLDSGKMLFIFRRGRWDIPKGKLEKGEKLEEGAVREVMEETGIPKPALGAPIIFRKGKQKSVYHTYNLNGKRILKSTYWWDMFVRGKVSLEPQLEEGIKEVKWVNPDNLKKYYANGFTSLKEVVKSSPFLKERRS